MSDWSSNPATPTDDSDVADGEYVDAQIQEGYAKTLIDNMKKSFDEKMMDIHKKETEKAYDEAMKGIDNE